MHLCPSWERGMPLLGVQCLVARLEGIRCSRTPVRARTMTRVMVPPRAVLRPERRVPTRSCAGSKERAVHDGAVEIRSPDGITDSFTGGLGDWMEETSGLIFRVDYTTYRHQSPLGCRSAVSLPSIGPDPKPDITYPVPESGSGPHSGVDQSALGLWSRKEVADVPGARRRILGLDPVV